jgi:hypothetical protein
MWPGLCPAAVLISDLHDLEPLDALGRANLDFITSLGLQQRPRDGRNPTDLVEFRARFINADNANCLLLAGGVQIGHGRTEKGTGLVGLLPGIDDFGTLDPLEQKAHPPVDLAQPLLAVDVIAVL